MTQMKGVYQGQISSQRFRKVELDEELYRRVMWCIRGPDGTWERLPKEANYQLENEEIEDGILDAQGTEWKVNLQNMEVTNILSTTKALKRLENLPDFIFPLYWDDMAPDETLKVVQLSPLCAEYQKVKQGFQLTCPKTVLKIERVQNIHLRRSYEAQRKHISDKNKLTGGANEKLLYHGTTQQNAKSIMSTGFDRRFSGQNATCYGQGSYFALNSSYSAHTLYSKPAADGTQLMFLARVLTGRHALGTRDMRVPPPLDPLNPDERFDSTVDNVTQPSMFVVFHDNQAYPDYLVSFR
ncbi:protein mono-ADP-ribosyltransferase PARP15-like [Eucyclogobius newberryi]|uniref:protein mono-ADP-ribosyltransferase PARP15-like n=1 Tax=Eucyclogobius newberryi TaxID=166745 RepID=UPI003B5B7371